VRQGLGKRSKSAGFCAIQQQEPFRMGIYIDRRLIELLETAGETGQVEAIIIIKDGRDSSPSWNDGGLLEMSIQTAIELTGEEPYAFRYFPRANAGAITASSRFMRQILKDENLFAASAVDIDAIVFPSRN
jgi:hypothetical protein